MNLKIRYNDQHRLKQINSIANAEPLGSLFYYAHVGLLSFAGFCGVVIFDLWWLTGVIAIYVVLLTGEKLLAIHARDREKPQLHGLLLMTLFCRAMTYNLLVLAAWNLEGDAFKLAAIALLMAATINIFVFHATHIEIITCVVVPIWLCLGIIAWIIFHDSGASGHAAAAVLIFLCITFYFGIALFQANKTWTELVRAQEALIQSQKQEALGKLVSGVAHDFNNVLAVTLGSAELIKNVESTQKDNLADEIIKSADRGAALVDQLLAFGRRSQLAPAGHHISEVFDNLQKMSARVLPSNIQITFAIAPDTPPVFADIQLLETAILNLVINAKDALPDGGRIEISAGKRRNDPSDQQISTANSCHDHHTFIRVRDTGVGVPTAVQSKVFDPFFTTKKPGEGSGLGLSMVIGFAEQSGGKVTFQSFPDRGTTVTLYMPSALERQVKPAVQGSRPAAGAGKHVLLVEDVEPLRDILCSQLITAGYAVTVAANADAAKVIISQPPGPDIIVSDIVMPGTLQGPGLVAYAREQIPNLPAVLISGYPENTLSVDGELLDASATGIPTELLSKPMRRETLLIAIENAMATHLAVNETPSVSDAP